MFSIPVLLLTAAVGMLIVCIYLLYHENERLEHELHRQPLDPESRRHLEIYQQIVQNAEWGIATRSADGSRIETANPKFAEIHGFGMDEILSIPVEELITQAEPASTRAYLRRIHSNDRFRFESVHRRKDGSTFPVLVDSSIIRDAAGNILYRVLNVLDFTEQKEQANQLARSEATLRLILESIPVGIWFTDAAGKIVYGNAAARRIWGGARHVPLPEYSVYESWSATSNKLVPAEDSALSLAIRNRETTLDQMLDIRGFDGSRKTILNSALPLIREDGGMDGAVVINQDITSIRRNNEALAQSQQNLRELISHRDRVREDERTRIAREIHDELGQHLTALRLDLGLIRMKYAQDHDGLQDDTKRMNVMLDDSINVLRNIASDLRPKALDMGFVPAARWLLSTLQKRTEIDYNLDLGQEDIQLSDEHATTAFRILQESLTNIIRHANADTVNISISKSSDRLFLRIIDDGKGFNPEQVASKNSFGLIGLNERALMLGGECVIDSAPGKGTTIHVEIPVRRQDQNASATAV